jgi:predicted patatin/cPLA2 family phospholipase
MMTWVRCRCLFIFVVCALLGGLVSGCAVNRHVLTHQELECRRGAYLDEASRDRTAAIAKIVRRMVREYAEYVAAGGAAGGAAEPVFDVLIVSGGGDKGAFAAGLLAGWATVEGPLARPKFDVVTGVSTGALIAPFAFTGDNVADARILKLYQEPQKDWSQVRDWFFFLPGRESFVDASGIKRDIQREMNDTILLGMARGAAEDRVLAIGTTNIDLGLPHTWDISEEAVDCLAIQKVGRVHDILRASAAIPAIFPPVVIDDALHVDGGTTSNILIIDDLRADDTPRHILRREHPEVPLPKIRYWIVINNRINPEPKIIQPTWVSITEASVDAMIRSSELTTLRQFAEQVEFITKTEPDAKVELRWMAIPDAWIPPQEGIFQPENMRALAELGMRLGVDPASWRTNLARVGPRDVETPPVCVPAGK